jgi:ribosomal-protein-alanine N-acetyltransferase
MLIGKNVSLRPPRIEEAQLIADWYNDPEYLGEFFNIWPTTREARERNITRERNRDEEGAYVIADRETGEPMGMIGYFSPFKLDFFRGLELWWQVHPRFRGQGIATQAACLLINHLFDATPVERIQATIVVGHERSCRVAEGAGMQRDGVYRNMTFLHGRYVDMHLYAIVRDDWEDEATYRQGRRVF